MPLTGEVSKIVPERNELPNQVKSWGKPKCVLLSKRRQCEKAIYCMIPSK